MHVQMLEAAKIHLENTKKYEVVAGYLSPAHDKYVARKLKTETITIDHRLAMCELALAENEWIEVSKWEGRQDGFRYWDAVLGVHREFIESKFPAVTNFVFMFVCGADLAVKSGGMLNGVCGHPAVIVGRQEYTKQLMAAKKGYKVDENKFFLVTEELQAISSTQIRKMLKTGGNLESLMHPAAAQYLRENVKYQEEHAKIGQEVEKEEGRERKEEEREEERESAGYTKDDVGSKGWLTSFYYCGIL
eukprot:Phypoly_transcript_15583.p1 GENE.Phypoly_transcript_15583~~Phypoly_transcript_15583.p1  ORF type:complete len:247 (+),score=59.62 Phypoly_transcript_15583:80-820(+)